MPNKPKKTSKTTATGKNTPEKSGKAKRGKPAKKATASSKSKTDEKSLLAKKALDTLKEIRPIAQLLSKPSVDAYSKANKIIGEMVYDKSTKKNITKIDELSFALSVRLSDRSLRGYATLDVGLTKQIRLLISKIEAYIKDKTQQRPLNFLMLASPGAGKSHFIKCIATQLARKNIGAITFNMAGMQSNDDLVPPLDSARNLKVADKVPLLFLDEFDSNPDNYALLLPFLWDGSLNLGQRDLKLGKAIVVMAGSNPILPETMDFACSMRIEPPPQVGKNPKLVDLLSRINGGIIKIPPFDDPVHKIDRRSDKVCIAIELLKSRFGDSISSVPIALLRFIAKIEFRYDVRSIPHLIDSIPYITDIKDLKISQLGLPFDSASKLKESSLAYHIIHEDQALGVLAEWEKAVEWKTSIKIDHDLSMLNLLLGLPEEHMKKIVSTSELPFKDIFS